MSDFNGRMTSCCSTVYQYSGHAEAQDATVLEVDKNVGPSFVYSQLLQSTYLLEVAHQHQHNLKEMTANALTNAAFHPISEVRYRDASRKPLEAGTPTQENLCECKLEI